MGYIPWYERMAQEKAERRLFLNLIGPLFTALTKLNRIKLGVYEYTLKDYLEFALYKGFLDELSILERKALKLFKKKLNDPDKEKPKKPVQLELPFEQSND
jgi:hypothetical protein